jgi:hypothetical protein
MIQKIDSFFNRQILPVIITEIVHAKKSIYIITIWFNNYA